MFDPEKECNELQEDIESEEDHGQVRGWMPTKRPCQKNSTLERKQVEKAVWGKTRRQLPVRRPDSELKDDGEIPLQQADLEHGLERVAHVG